MKKLNKIKLNDFQEMSDMEMKNVVGGSGAEVEGSGDRSNLPWYVACKNKNLGDSCSFEHNGKITSGKCSQNAFQNYGRYCSTLNVHY